MEDAEGILVRRKTGRTHFALKPDTELFLDVPPPPRRPASCAAIRSLWRRRDMTDHWLPAADRPEVTLRKLPARLAPEWGDRTPSEEPGERGERPPPSREEVRRGRRRAADCGDPTTATAAPVAAAPSAAQSWMRLRVVRESTARALRARAAEAGLPAPE